MHWRVCSLQRQVASFYCFLSFSLKKRDSERNIFHFHIVLTKSVTCQHCNVSLSSGSQWSFPGESLTNPCNPGFKYVAVYINFYWAHLCMLHGGLIGVTFCPSVCLSVCLSVCGIPTSTNISVGSNKILGASLGVVKVTWAEKVTPLLG